MEQALFGLIVALIVVGLLLGLAIFMIRKAPFIPGEFKQGAEWLCWALAILVILFRAWPLIGGSV